MKELIRSHTSLLRRDISGWYCREERPNTDEHAPSRALSLLISRGDEEICRADVMADKSVWETLLLTLTETEPFCAR